MIDIIEAAVSGCGSWEALKDPSGSHKLIVEPEKNHL